MRFVPVITVALVCAPHFLAAQDRDSDLHWERRLSSGQRVHAHNINGDITVTRSSSGRVEITGIRKGSGRYANRLNAQVNETPDGIMVCVVRTDSDDECDS